MAAVPAVNQAKLSEELAAIVEMFENGEASFRRSPSKSFQVEIITVSFSSDVVATEIQYPVFAGTLKVCGPPAYFTTE